LTYRGIIEMLPPAANPTINLPIRIAKKFSKEEKILPIINIMSNNMIDFLLPILLAKSPEKNEPFVTILNNIVIL